MIRLNDTPGKAALATRGTNAGTQPVDYFQRPWPVTLVFGAFFLIVVPLGALRVIPNAVGVLPFVILLEAVGLGTSHFFITLAVYLQRENLRYFASNAARKALYFALPLAILTFVAWLEASDQRAQHPVFAGYFYALVRLLDFLHVGRQSVGMLQIFKRPIGSVLPRWTRYAENAFFVGMATLQWETFALGGQFAEEQPYARLPALVLGALLLVLIGRHVAAIAAAPFGARALLPLAYLIVQAACSAAAVYATWLYVTVLAVHYLEYHVIMWPRLRAATASQPRVGLWPVYAGLSVLVVAFEARNYVQPKGLPLRFAIHMFDGIFLVHYILDAFLWKFSGRYYRAALTPLYFQLSPERVVRGASSRRLAWGLCAAALVLTLTAATARPLRESLARRVIDPLNAQEHLRWGRQLAADGQLTDAHRHLELAARLDPQDDRASRLARWLREHAREERDASR